MRKDPIEDAGQSLQRRRDRFNVGRGQAISHRVHWRDRVEQLANGHSEAARQTHQHFSAGLGLRELDAPDVLVVQVRARGETFLRQLALEA